MQGLPNSRPISTTGVNGQVNPGIINAAGSAAKRIAEDIMPNFF